MSFEIEVRLPPGLTNPPPLLPYLRAGMETATERVRVAGEAAAPRRQALGPIRRKGKGYGPLAGSLTRIVFTSGPHDGAVGYVRSDVFYGRFLERGTAAHPIVAKHRRRDGRPGVLAWLPGPTFRRRVQAPALRPRWWFRGAAESERPAVEGIFERQAQAWAAAFGR